jgi:glycerol uptake facilitator-like aquaporin
MSNRITAKLLAEFIGTFALIFIGAGAAAVIGSGAGLPGVAAIAFAHGLTVMAFAFAYGTVSGGHFNPSVTIAVLAAGAMRVGEAAGYVVSQLAGGILGALLLRVMLGGAGTSLGTPDLAHNLGLGATTLTVTPWAGYVIEAVLGFFLSTVVLSTAVAGRAGNLQHHHGRAPHRRRLQSGARAWPDGRDRQFQRCLVVPDGPDRWRNRRSHSAHGARPARARADCSERPRGRRHARRMSLNGPE